MSDAMIGMNVAEVERFGRQLRDVHAAGLRQAVQQMEQLIAGTKRAWAGTDAEAFRSWWPPKRSRLLALADDLESYGTYALRNAAEQVQASAGANSLGSLPPSRSVQSFGTRGSGRAVVVDAIDATTGRRTAIDESEIRKLDNGRYIVVLPGVVDLTSAGGDVAKGYITGGGGAIGLVNGVGKALNGFYDNPHPNTVRRMEYAMSEARDGDTFVNPYSERVMQQMKAAGVPEGADVMLVGHSYGAYTAMDLAANQRFNSAGGSFEGYHVNVTHVVAAAADTNWRFDELPPETHALVLNNKHDLVFRAEDGFEDDVAPMNSNQLEIEFNNNPLAGISRAGHEQGNYTNWLAKADRGPLNAWLDGAGALYDGPGTAYSVKVPDYE